MKSRDILAEMYGEDEEDDLLSFLTDIIFDYEKDRIVKRRGSADPMELALTVAVKKAELYKTQILELIGDEFDPPGYGVVGGYADGAGFSLELEDRREIVGNERGARFVSK